MNLKGMRLNNMFRNTQQALQAFRKYEKKAERPNRGRPFRQTVNPNEDEARQVSPRFNGYVPSHGHQEALYAILGAVPRATGMMAYIGRRMASSVLLVAFY